MKDLELIGSDRFKYLLETKQNISNLQVTEEVLLDNDSVFGKNSVTLTNCTFDLEFRLKGNHLRQKIYFIDCTFVQRFLSVNLDLSELKFLKCTFDQFFKSKNLTLKRFDFERCQFNLDRELVINEFKADSLFFVKNEFNRDIQLLSKEVRVVSLVGGESNNLLTLSNRGNNNVVDRVFIEFNSNHKTDFLLRNLNVEYIQITGELKDATLSINNLKFQTGIIKYFSNQGNILLNSILPKSQSAIIVLKGTSLGKAIISSTDFSKFSKIQLSNSSLIDIVPVNTKWCEAKPLKEPNSLEERKEIYRQLKVVAERNFDTPTKQLYHKYEMTTHLSLLKQQNGKCGDKFILRMSQLSNNHGLNWVIAFSWLLGLSIIWYTLVKFCLGQTVFNPNLIGSEIGHFINFVNPVHYFDRVFDTKVGVRANNALLFDGLSRVTGAYLIYQFVSAFRKYSKK